MLVQKGKLNEVRLLQTSRAKLSTIRSNEGIVRSITNCSFFTSTFVCGRDQGDERNDTHPDRDNAKFCDVVILKDGSYHAGKFNSWDYPTDVVAGFSACAFLVKDGKNCEIYSEGIDNAEGIVKTKTHRTAFAILTDGACLQIVDYNVTGFELRDKLEKDYDIDLLAILDGGGSTEMIVGGVIVSNLKDGSERAMWNGLAFVDPIKNLLLRYPCIEGWDSQTYKSSHKGLDFGWCSAKGNGHTDIQACADGVVEFEGFYEQKFASGTFKPIGVIIRHNQFSKSYDYISIYWHLASTCVDKGQVVKEGQKIGIKGNTGFSGGIHLHYQLLKIPKGSPIPDQHNPSKADNWAKVSVNPIDLLRVHADQYFQYTGNFDLKAYTEEVTDEFSELKSKYEALSENYEALLDEYSTLEAKYAQLEADKEQVEEVLGSTENTLNTALNTLQTIKELLNANN